MKKHHIILPLLCLCTSMAAQENIQSHHHPDDSTDVFYRHLQLNELVVTGVTGDTKLKHSTAPISIVRPQELRATSSTNIIDAIARQPGIAQLTTGSGISKPIIRGLGYNRVVVISDGVRQEGQQWGDEHGVEVDDGSVNSVEILKGPASLMYGSDAMAGVVILQPRPTMAEGTMQATAASEYQTNNGLLGYSLSMAGNQQGFVWDARFSQKLAHAYKNQQDGYVPGSQFRQHAGRLMLGTNKSWGHSHLTGSFFHQTPSIAEGEESAEGANVKTYGKTLPFQRIGHYKLVWDHAQNLPAGVLKAIMGYQQNCRKEFEESYDEPELFLKLHTVTYDLRYLTNELAGWRLSAGLGGMWQQSKNKGEEYLIPDYQLFDIGLFATASKTLNRWTLSGGLRYDHRHLHGDELADDGEMRFADFSRNFSGLTGSIGAVLNVSDHLNLRINVARGFRTPNISELASNGVHEGSQRYERGNQQLKAEYSLQADLGLDFTSRYFSAQLALFANRIDNYIFLQRSEEVYDPEFQNYAYQQGDARLLGFEAGIDLHPVHSLHFANTFSYVNARQLEQPADSRYLPFTPAPRWTSELKWELIHHSHSTIGHNHANHKHFVHGLSLNNTYLSANIDCYLDQDNIREANQTETRTPGYALLNMQAGTDIHWQRRKIAEFYITAHNLFNRAYTSHLSRLKYIEREDDCVGYCNMGRNITFKLVVPIDL